MSIIVEFLDPRWRDMIKFKIELSHLSTKYPQIFVDILKKHVDFVYFWRFERDFFWRNTPSIKKLDSMYMLYI